MSEFNPYTDVAREAQHDYYADAPHERDETPSREDVAELEGPRPFEVPPGSERRGGWWLVRPEYRTDASRRKQASP
jgi:hypothetical protein